MHGIHPELGIKGVIFAVILELLFLGVCAVLIGHGWAELRKKKNAKGGLPIMLFGLGLATLSLWMAKLFIEG